MQEKKFLFMVLECFEAKDTFLSPVPGQLLRPWILFAKAAYVDC